MPKELLAYIYFLFAFIFVNVLIYFLIQLKAKEKLFKKLFLYWFSVLAILIIEGTFVEGKLTLSLIFLVNFVPIAIMSSFLLSMYNFKFHARFYLFAIPLAVVLTLLFNYLDAPFVLTSMPIVLVCTGPLFEGLYVCLIVYRYERQITKTIACYLYGAGIFSCFYYAFNRYEATEIQYYIGFGSAFLSYIMCSMLLPIVCIQMINAKKTEYLEALVRDRTRELSESKEEKEKLLRVLVHDISNPLQVAMFQIGQIKKFFPDEAKEVVLLDKVTRSLNSIRDIITHVREYECVLSGTRTTALGEVYVRECLAEVEEMFSDRFKSKNVQLIIRNKLHPDTKIRVDKNPFIYSVASNLVSNALKFSMPGSEVLILAYEKDSNVVIDVIDRGIGMSGESLKNLFDIGITTSRSGTLGESGTGFGMPIVKAYTMMFGGRIEANSSQEELEKGTTISLYLPFIDPHTHSEAQLYLS